jgi:hypothetical protein
MYTLHFQNKQQMAIAVAICNEERNKWGMEYRPEAGNIIRLFEPEYVANKIMTEFNIRNCR